MQVLEGEEENLTHLRTSFRKSGRFIIFGIIYYDFKQKIFMGASYGNIQTLAITKNKSLKFSVENLQHKP